MSVRQSRTYKVFLWVMTLACLGGAGYLGYATFFGTGSLPRQVKSAEDAYARGLESYQQKNWSEAATRFAEAEVHADKAMDNLKAQSEAKKMPVEEGRSIHGRLLWVKARAMRDQAYAKGHADGKPLPDVPDPQYNEIYRTFTAIPEADERRANARHILQTAASLLVSDSELGKEVLKETLRSELAYTPINWPFVEPLLRKSLEINKNDARANYYLARFEYEQPGDDRVTPIPLERRSAERIDRAREYLAAAKQSNPPAPHWRTVGLEADILYWPVSTAAARKLKPDVIAAAEKAVDPLLFDPQTGAVAAAGRGEKLTGLSTSDAMGLVSVLSVGFDRAAADARKPGGNVDRVRTVNQAALDLTKKMADEAALQQFLSIVAPALVTITTQAQPFLAKADPAGWREHITSVEGLLAKSPDAVKRNPQLRLHYARLISADAKLAALANDTARAKELRDRAIQELAGGLKTAEDAKLTGPLVDELNGELAEVKLLSGAKAEEIEPHITRLKASSRPQMKLWGQLLEGGLAAAQGRLDKARKLLQPIAADRTNPDYAFQANVMLAEINTSLEDWAPALGALREVEARYNAADLSPSARAWADERLGGADLITAGIIGANLGTAIQVASRHARDNPGKPIPPDLLAGYESAAEGLAKKLRAPSAADRSSRLALAGYYVNTARRKLAEERLDALAVDYPDSIDVLRLRCRVLATPTVPGATLDQNGVAAADVLIRRFLKDYPADKAARLFNAEWLVRTGRAEKAVEYLKDPANFPGGRDEAVERLLAMALFGSGQREEGQKILGSLTPEPLIDAVLIEAATTKEMREKRVKEALGRYENPGLFRLYEAGLRLSEGKYEEAVRGFASATEFTRVGNTARSYLRRALMRYADAEPAKARDAAVRLATEMPDEPGVYLGAAVAALFLDDVGAPDDKWEHTKTMYAAVNRWEVAAAKAGTDPTDMTVTKVLFRLFAGDVAGAKQETVTALNRNPKNVRLQLAMAELSLAPPADPVQARVYLDAATKENPNDPRLPLIDAAIRVSARDWAGAAAAYEKLATSSPRNVGVYPKLIAALESGDRKADALRWARIWAEQIPEDNRATTAIIRLLTADGKKDEAIKIADDLVAKRVAETRQRLTNTKPPLPQAEANRLIDEVKGGALLAAGSGFFHAKAYDQAEARVIETLKTFPDAAPVRLMLGDIAISRKEWDRALEVYRELLKKNPRHFVAGNNAAWILAEMKNDPAAALAIVEEIRKARDGDRAVAPERLPADFLDTIGVIYVKLNKPDRNQEMRSMFEAAVKRHPTDPRMYLYLGHALAATGERSRALTAFDEAIRLAGTKNGLPDEQNKAAAASAEAARKKLQN